MKQLKALSQNKKSKAPFSIPQPLERKKPILNLQFEPSSSQSDISEQELYSYAQIIGIQLPEEEHLLNIAREGLMAELPPHWKHYQLPNGEILYKNTLTGESSTEHPCDEEFREKVIQERKKCKINQVKKTFEKKSKSNKQKKPAQKSSTFKEVFLYDDQQVQSSQPGKLNHSKSSLKLDNLNELQLKPRKKDTVKIKNKEEGKQKSLPPNSSRKKPSILLQLKKNQIRQSFEMRHRENIEKLENKYLEHLNNVSKKKQELKNQAPEDLLSVDRTAQVKKQIIAKQMKEYLSKIQSFRVKCEEDYQNEVKIIGEKISINKSLLSNIDNIENQKNLINHHQQNWFQKKYQSSQFQIQTDIQIEKIKIEGKKKGTDLINKLHQEINNSEIDQDKLWEIKNFFIFVFSNEMKTYKKQKQKNGCFKELKADRIQLRLEKQKKEIQELAEKYKMKSKDIQGQTSSKPLSERQTKLFELLSNRSSKNS